MYRPQEAQAILNEVRSIRDAISSGEKEKQELMQVRLKKPCWKTTALYKVEAVDVFKVMHSSGMGAHNFPLY